MLGFLLRGCIASTENQPQKAIFSVDSSSVDSSSVGALILCRDSIGLLLSQISRLKERGVKVISKTTLIHDTITSSPKIVTVLNETKVTDTLYVDAKRASQNIEFKDSFLFCRVVLDDNTATLDSLAVFDDTKVTTNEIQIDKYMVQRSAVFERKNPYLSRFNEAYVEMPRYSDLGLTHLKKTAKRKGIFWGIITGAVATAAYFLVK